MLEALMELVGQTVGGGRFRLERALDRGGMGAVFAGVEVATGQPVAIKVIHPGLGEEPELLARFQREAQVIARLEHPHVVRAVAAGGGDGEAPFIVMELLSGGSLEARLQAGESFDARQAVVIARQILAALTASHAIGVIHRDLKPANVMIVDGPAGPVAKLVDFGVARLTMGEAMTELTATGQVVGTAAYMAPEQALGAPADARADVFAVGAILHRLLAGRPPYGAGGYARVLERIVGDHRERIHDAMPGRGALADVIEVALAYAPEQRFQSAAALARALDGIDAGAHDTVVHWRPPVELETLRLPPAAMDTPAQVSPPTRPSGAGVSAASRPSFAEAVQSPARDRSRAPIAALLVVAAVGLGSAGTWVVLRPASAGRETRPAEAEVPAASEGAVVPVAPVDISPLESADAVVPVEDKPAAAAAPLLPERTARRRTAPGAGVTVRFSGGTYPVAGHRGAIRQALSGPDFSSCWPRQAPMPENNRGATYRLEFGPDGRVGSVELLGRDLYPEFNRCMEGRLIGLDVGAEFAGQDMRANYGLYAPRRR